MTTRRCSIPQGASSGIWDTRWTPSITPKTPRAAFGNGLRHDLVLTDQTMPQMTGIELARAIRACAPEIPILLMSGYEDEGPIKEALEDPDALPFDRFLPKPFEGSDLALHLHQLLATRKESRSWPAS